MLFPTPCSVPPNISRQQVVWWKHCEAGKSFELIHVLDSVFLLPPRSCEGEWFFTSCFGPKTIFVWPTSVLLFLLNMHQPFQGSRPNIQGGPFLPISQNPLLEESLTLCLHFWISQLKSEQPLTCEHSIPGRRQNV